MSPAKTRATQASAKKGSGNGAEQPVAGRKALTGKATSKNQSKGQPKAGTSTAPKPAEMRKFMENQALINESILNQLKVIGQQQRQTDKSGHIINDLVQGKEPVIDNFKGIKPKRRVHPKAKNIVLSSDSESDTEQSNDSDAEELARADMNEANDLLSARFHKNKGKIKTSKSIEQNIKHNRPYAFLDRDTQRQLVREYVHPEELSCVDHIEGLSVMITAQCNEVKTKAMLNHLCQIICDCQVHPWSKVWKWSNDVVVRTATQEWELTECDLITQSRNSCYMIQTNTMATERIQPCFEYNFMSCKFEDSHFGMNGMFAHICAFCNAVDGSRDAHQSKTCSKRRSSANYFRSRDENPQAYKRDRSKKQGQNNTRHEPSSKN